MIAEFSPRAQVFLAKHEAAYPGTQGLRRQSPMREWRRRCKSLSAENVPGASGYAGPGSIQPLCGLHRARRSRAGAGSGLGPCG